jgi:hypothetical protein
MCACLDVTGRQQSSSRLGWPEPACEHYSISSRLGWPAPPTANTSRLHTSALLVPSAKPSAGIALCVSQPTALILQQLARLQYVKKSHHVACLQSCRVRGPHWVRLLLSWSGMGWWCGASACSQQHRRGAGMPWRSRCVELWSGQGVSLLKRVPVRDFVKLAGALCGLLCSAASVCVMRRGSRHQRP